MCCQGVRPFSPYQAVGVRILYSVARGRYAATDVYWAHAALSDDDKADVVLVSDRCVRQSWLVSYRYFVVELARYFLERLTSMSHS